MSQPQNNAMPTNTAEAFARIGALNQGPCTIDDLRVLALSEAIGLELYESLAQQTDNADVQKLLRVNGREEMAHAHRVSKAIEILTGEPFPIPAIADIPFYTPLPAMPVTKESLEKLAQGEFGGKDMYVNIAASFDDPAAVALFLQNGKEEAEHGERLLQAAAILAA